MTMAALTARPLVLPAHAQRSRRTAAQRLVTCSKPKDFGTGGIHDPIGVGQGEKVVKKLDQSQEEQRRLMQQRLQQQHSAVKGGASGLSREAAAERELLAVEAERQQGGAAAAQQQRSKSLQSMESDEEYANMHPAQKWVMEAKAALYSWLKTGVEI